MNWLPIVINFLLAIHIIVSLLIVLLVLMQRPKNEGLGAAFGGGMTENLFGAQTTNVLQTATRYLGGLFFALTLLLSWLYVQKGTSGSSLQQKLSAPTVIPAAPTPVPTTPPPVDKVQPLPSATPVPAADGKLQLPSATPVPAVDTKLLPEGATPPSLPSVGREAVSDSVKVLPAPAPGSATPAPAAPKSTSAEKPADKPAATPSPPQKPN